MSQCLRYLSSSLPSDSETEQSGLFCVALHLELSEAGSVAFDRLGNLSVDRVELHGSHHTVLLGRETQARINMLGNTNSEAAVYLRAVSGLRCVCSL